MNGSAQDKLRKLPSIARCIESAEGKSLQARFGQGVTATAARRVIERVRSELKSGALEDAPELDAILKTIDRELVRNSSPAGRCVINATGILLHTGLGRSPLPRTAIDALSVMDHYSILEVSIEDGERRNRDTRVEELIVELTGCEAATVVNNNAAATFIVLNTMAKGKEVLVSRGQLIEIGGSYRMPDVMEQSGVKLREIGTTNRTHLRDYENAIGPDTGAIIHVHTSNYKIHGFTSMPGIEELCELGRRAGIPVIDDLGSGALASLAPYGIQDRGMVAASIRAGASAACFSGDKLICGPQAGIIVGSRDAVARVRKNPFARMFRVDKLCLAALEATLTHFVNGGEDLKMIPLYHLLSRTPAELWMEGEKLLNSLTLPTSVRPTLQDDSSYLGGGAMPDEAVPSVSLRIENVPRPDRVARELRTGLPSVFCRLHDGALVFDLRTVFEDEYGELAERISSVLAP